MNDNDKNLKPEEQNTNPATKDEGNVNGESKKATSSTNASDTNTNNTNTSQNSISKSNDINHTSNNKGVKIFQQVVLIVAFLLLGAIAGYYFGVKGYEVKIKTEVRDIEILNKEDQIADQVDFSRFWEVWRIVNEKYIDKPIDPNTLLDGAIHGMVASLDDPYTVYLNPEQNKIALSSLNGKYEGIGAQLGYDDNKNLVIIAPLDGSPAEAAGVKAGDIIYKIEGESTAGISISEAVHKIRGPAGTSITLTMIREGEEEPFDVTIRRDEIKIDSVTWEDKGAGIAYIRVSRFGETTNMEWAKAVSEIKSQMPNLRGVIVDVRNNPGGYLESAVYISSEFLEKGTVVKEEFSDGTKKDFTVDHKGRLTDEDVNVAILINEGSASASEIVTGALKERRDGIIIGKRSFGKGSVQRSEEFSDGAALHVTVAKWLTPDDNWIDKTHAKFEDSVYNEKDENGNEIIGGFKPDIEVDLTEDDYNNKKDPQLDKAIEYLQEQK